MKKFMIFLLMAFLYLGTSQARSEAPHFSNAKAPLLSWVTPSSHSFFADSKAVNSVVVTVSPSAPQSMGLNVPSYEIVYSASVTGLDGTDPISYRWYLNGNRTDSVGPTFRVSGYPAGTYNLYCKVNHLYESNTVIFTVSADVTANIVGPRHACQNDVVTLTAMIENSSDVTVNYQWKHNGDYIPGATSQSYSFIPANLPGLANDTLAHEFSVEITRSGCESSLSPVHYFTVSPTPVTQLTATQVCSTDPVLLTANSYTSGDEQPWKWNWYRNGSFLTTTYVNTYEITTPVEGDVYVVIPVYQDFACNDLAGDTITITPATVVTKPTIFTQGEVCEIVNHTETQEITTPTRIYTSCYTYVLGLIFQALNPDYVQDNEHDCAIQGIDLWHRFYKDVTETGTIEVVVPEMVCTPAVANDTVCAGTTVTVTATPNDADSYIWYVDGVEVPGENLAQLTLTFQHAATHYFQVKAVSATGCVSEISNADTIVVEAPRMFAITGDNVLCDGDAATLTATAIGVEDYTWYGPVTGTGRVLNNATAGTYMVVGTSEHGCIVASEPFTVYNIGTDLQVVASATNVCAGEHVTLNANISDLLTGNVTYAWSTGSTNPTIDVVPTAALHSYTVTATYGNCTNSASIDINVNTAAAAPSIAGASTLTICQYAQQSFSVSNPAANTSYTWYVDGVEVAGATLATFAQTFNEPGIHEVRVSSTTSEGCTSAVSSAVTVTVETAPTIMIAGDALICNNDFVELTANINDYNHTFLTLPTDVHYEWRISNVTVENQLTLIGEFAQELSELIWNSDLPIFRYQLPAQDQPYVITVVATSSANGCTTVSDPYYVYVSNDINVNVTLDYNEVCAGGMVTATAHLADYNTPNLVYQWSVNGVPVAHGTERIFTTPVTADNTVISVQVTQTTSGCTATGSATANIFNPATVHSVVAINGMNEADQVCEGAEITVTAYLDQNHTVNPNLTYVWTENGHVMPNTHGYRFSKQVWALDHDPVDYIYTAYVFTDVPGCAAVPVSSDTVHVRRNPMVVLDGMHYVCFTGVEDMNLRLVARVDGTVDPAATYTFYRNGRRINTSTQYGNVLTENIQPTHLNSYTYLVEVNNGNGCSAFSEPFSVEVYDAPVVNILASDTIICYGGEVELQARINNYNDPMLTYQWYQNNVAPVDLLPGRTLPYETFQVSTTTSYIVEVTHLLQNSQNNMSYCSDRDTITIHVIEDPVVILSTNIPANHEICEGQPVKVVASVQGGVIGTEVFSWYRNGELIQNITGDTLVDFPQAVNGYPTTYTYEVSVSQRNSGCISVLTFVDTVVVNPNPTLAIETDPIVCGDGEGNVKLYAHVSPAPTTPYTFNWFEDNVALTGATGEHLDTLILTKAYRDYPYNFSVSLVNSYGCQAVAETQVYVDTVPVINVTASDANICVGGEVTLTAHLNDWNTTNMRYQWYEDNNAIAGATDLTLVVAPTTVGAHNYKFTAIQQNSHCNAASEFFTVTVHPDPVIASVTLSDTIVCQGAQIMITANLDSNTLASNDNVYTWYRNGILMPGAVAQTIYDSPVTVDNNTQQYIYSVTVATPMTGCVSAPATSAALTIYPNPTVVITGDQFVCATDSVFLQANTDSIGTSVGLLHYQWYESGMLRDNMAYTLGDNQFYAEYWYPRDEPYRFVVEVQREGVPAACAARSAEYLVYVLPVPDVNITATETEICTGGEVTLTANLVDPNAQNITYQWYEIRNRIDTFVVGYSGGQPTYFYAYTPYRYDIPGANSRTYTAVYTDTTKVCVEVIQTTSQCHDIDSVLIIVNPDPVLTITNDLPASKTLCDGRSVTFEATVEGGVPGGEIYTWYRNGEVIPNAVGAIFTETPHAISDYPTVYVYEVSVKQTANGCESIVTLADTVTVNPNPTLAIETDPIVCSDANNNITMVAHVYPEPTTDYTFTWFEDNAVITGATGVHADTIVLTKPYRDYPYNFSISLVNQYGCQATAETVIYVDTVPVVNIAATEDTICVGGEITLTANLNNWNTPNMQYQWYDNGNLIAGATSLTYTVVPTQGVHAYTFTAKQLNSLCQATSNTVNVTVNADPTITLTNDLPASKTLCDGRSVTFTATVAGGVTGGEVFTWYRNGEVIPDAVGAIFTETVHAISDYPTVYVYEVSVKQTAAGCESIVTLADTVTVNPNPTLTIQTDPIVCGDNANNIMMVANILPEPTTNYTFAWYEENVALTGATGAHLDTIVLTRPYRDYPYNFSVVLVNEYGCQATAETSIYVDSVPVINIVASETQICVGGEITLTANLNNWNTANMEYQWYRDGNLIAGATSLTYTEVPASGVRAYTFTAKQINSLCQATSNTVNVTVNADPTLTITNDLPASRTLCDGRSVTFTATVAGGVNGGEVYTWYRNGEVIPGAVSAVYTETPHAISDYPTVYVYEVSVKQTAAGCESIVTLADTVTVNPNPTLAIETDPIVCNNGQNNILMIARVYPEPTTNYSFTWFQDNRELLTGAAGPHSEIMTLTRPYRDYPYNFSVVLVNEYGCQATAETQIYVDRNPVVNTSVTESDICVGGEVTLTAHLNDWNTQNMQYQWYHNNSPIPGATSLTYTTVLTQEGAHAYTFKATQLNSLCEATSRPLTVTVHADPTVTTTNDLPASKTLCDGRSVTFTATVAGGVTGGEVYTWYRNGEVIPNAVGSIFTETVHAISDYPTVYVYEVSVKQTATGCESVVTLADTVTVNPNPTLAIETDPIVCDDAANNIKMIAHVYPEPTTNYSFTWFEDNAVITGATGTHADTMIMTKPYRDYPYNFSISMVNEYGCQATAETYIYVDTVPVVNIAVTEDTICIGGEITLTANLNNWNTPNMQYQWYDNGNLIAGATSLTYTVVPTEGAHAYTFTAKQLNSLCHAISNTVNVTVNPDPIVTAITINGVASDTLCDGAQVTLAATITPANANAVYTWYRNGIEIPGANQSTFSENVYTNDNQITVNVYTAKVVLPAAGCESAISTVHADAVVFPAPSNVSISGESIVCNRETTTLIVTADGAYMYSWDGGPFTTDSSFQAGPGVHYVIAQSIAGCNSASNSFTVRSIGTDLQISATATSICEGEHVTLNADLQGLVDSNVVYIWSTTPTNHPTIDVQPDSTTTYTVTAVYDGCSNEASITILVHHAPAVPTVVGPKDDILCEGDQAQFVASVTGTPEAVSYIWYLDGVEIPGENLDTLNLNLTAIGTHNINARAISSEGCISGVSTNTTITIEAAPSLLTVTGNNIICYGDSTLLIAHAEGAASYQWSTGVFADRIYASAGVYTVTAYSANGCKTVSDPFTVNEFGPDVQITADQTAVCAGTPVVLNANEDGWVGNIVYTWEDGTHTSTHTIVPTTSGWHKVTSTVTSNGYDTHTCTRVDSIYITVYALPVVNGINILGNDTICEGTQVTLAADPDTAASYRWFENGIEIPGHNLDTIIVMPEPGVHYYAVQLINEYGCESAHHAISTPIVVLPNPTIMITGDPLICNDSLITLYANINDTTNTNAQNALYNYEWRVYNYTLVPGGATTHVDPITGESYYVHPLGADSPILQANFPAQDHPYIFTVHATNTNGCLAKSDPYYVYVEDTIFVAVTVDHDAVCQGGEVTATAHLGNYNTQDLVYQWFKNGVLIPYATEPIFTTSIDEDSTVLTVTVTQTTTGCNATGSDTVYFFYPPQISSVTAVNGTQHGDDIYVCEGAQITVTAVMDSLGTTDSTLRYIWKENGFLMPLAHDYQFSKQMWILDHDSAMYTYEAYIDIDVPGCVPYPVYSNRVHVRRNPIVIIDGVHNVCFHDVHTPNVYLTAMTDGGQDVNAIHKWYRNGFLTYNSLTHDNMYIEMVEPTHHDPVTYMVEVINGNGCSAFSEPFQVEVYAAPVVNILASDTLICEGGEVELQARINNYNDPMLVFEWYRNEINPGHLMPGRTHATEVFSNLTETTTFFVHVTHLMNDNSGGHTICDDYDQITIHVNPDPVVTLTNDLPDGKTLCDGRSVTFTTTVTGGVPGGEVFTWYRNGEIIPDAVGPQFTETPHAISDYPTTYIYQVSVRQATTGCESIVTVADTVIVNPNPTVEIETDPIVCRNDNGNIMMVAHVYPEPTTAYSFNWFEDNVVLNGATGAHNDTIVLTREYRDYPYHFSVSLVNEYGCQATDEAIIYVDTLPVINITSTEYEICVGGEITLTANLDNWNTPNMEYHWYDNNVLIPGATSLTYTVVPDSGAHVYTFTAEQLNSHCSAISNAVTVNVHADPTITVTNDLPASKTLCDGRSVTFEATVHGGVAGGEIFTWYRNGEVIPNAVGATFTETPHAISDYPTVYVYEVSVKQTANGCESVVTFADTVTVVPNPTVTIQTDPIVCGDHTGNVVMIANIQPEPTTAYSFNWYEDNALLTSGMTGAHNDTITLTRPYRDYPYNFSVVLVNEYGCQATDEATIYVDTVPVINITATETEICVGGEITLTANLDNWNTPNMEFHWYDNGNLILGATSLTYTVVPDSGAHNYTFSAKQLNSLCQATSNVVTVNVHADPTITVTNDLPASKTLCDGRSVTFVATVHGGVTGGEIFTWYRNGEVIPNAIGSIFTETPHAISDYPTVYVYEVSVKQTANGCESIVTFADTLTVVPNPTVVIETDPIVCRNDNGNITMVAHVYPEPTTAYSFNWFEENVALTGATGAHNETITLTREYRDYPYNFSVSLVNEYGCQATAETQVYVDTIPVINIASTEYDICIGGEVTLTANLNNWNTPNMEYHWYDNGNLIAGATSLTYTVVPTPGIHNYTFSAEQLNSHCSAISNVATVTVHADPTITVTNDLPASKTLCDGRSVTFEATVNGGVAGGEIFTWYRNGEVIPNAVGATFTETPHAISDYPTVYVYEVSVKQTANGCESVVTFADTVTVNPNPTLAIETDPIVCRNDNGNITMIAHVYPEPTTAYTFTWFEDNAVITGATGAHNETITLTREYRDYPYNFSISLVNEYGCQATAETQVYVDTLPVVNIEVTENLICVGGEITLTANLNNWNTPNMEYHWYDNGNLIAGATSLTYTVVPTEGDHVYTFSAKQLNSLCQATSNAITVNVIPDPVIANVTLSDTIVCQGAQIAITANAGNYVPSTDDVYTWYRNGVLIPGATAQTIYDSPVTVDNNTQQYIYTAVVTRTPSGCTSLPVASAALTIYPNPTVVITGDQHVCETDSIFLIANVDTIGGNVGTLHYTWYESGMIRDNMAYGYGDNQFYGEYWYARVEPYRFTVEVQREGVAAGCASTSAEYLVYVYPQPVVNITATETEICEGGEVTLTANLVDPNAQNMIYQWYEIRHRVDTFETGYDSLGNFTYTYFPITYHYNIPGANSATYTTTYNETITMGVVAYQTPSTCFDTDEITITVNPRPVVTSVTVNGVVLDTVCDGAQVNLAATITPADAQGAVYTWFRNGVEIPGANQSTFSENVYTNDNQVTTNVYTVMVTLPASGCVSEVSVPNATVVVNPAPSTVTISGNNVICEGDSTVLTVYSDVDGIITWSTGSHESSITVPAGVYTVTVTTPEGCEKTSDPFTVEALGTDLLVSASETHICAGEHTTLYVNQDGWAGNVSYQWCAEAGNSTATTVDVHPDVTTTYTVTATVNSSNNIHGCTAVGEVTIIVTPLPTTLVVTGDTTICQGDQATLTASTTDSDITGYIWYQNGVEIPGENQAVLTINFPDYGTYTYVAKAVNNQGCVSAIASNPAIVTVNPAPTVVSITGNNIICENDMTNLTVYSDVTGTITWSTGSHDANINVPAGVYTVTVTTPEGCEMTSAPFTVEALGTDLLVSASETHICAGEHTTLYVNQDGWAGNVTYQWSANADSSVATTVDVAPEVTTTYTVTATVNSTNNMNGCTAIGEVTIVVTPLPAIVTVNASADSVCEGEQVTFTATPADPTYTYIWYQNGIEIAGEHQNVITVNFPIEGAYTFAAKAVNPDGCESAEASAPVTVYVSAAPDAVVISGNLEICNGGTTTLYADVTPHVAGATYQWYQDNVAIAGATGYFLTVTTAGSYKVDVTTNGCTTTSDAVNVIVNEAPQLQLTATEQTICQFGTTVISAEATGWNNNEVNYTWSNGYHGSSFTFTPTVAGDYTFSVTASLATSGCTAVDQITIHVNAAPAAPVVTVNNALVCEGGQITLTMTDTNAVNYGTPIITWYDNGAYMAGNQTSVTLTPALGQHNYNVSVEYPNSGCNTAISEIVVVNVIPQPTVAIELTSGNNNVLCDGGSTTLTANVTPAGFNYNYQWFQNNVEITGATNSTLDVTLFARESTYDYQVVVTAAPGCIVVSDVTSITVVSDPVVVASVDNAIICEGGVATFSVAVDGGVSNVNGLNGYTYAWYSNLDHSTPIANTPTFTVNNATAGTYAYEVVVTSPYGCSTTSNIVNLTVVEDPTVTVAVAAGYDATICENGSTVLVANVTGGYGTPSYQWYSNGLPILGETNRTLVLNNVANNNFVYTVKVTQTGVDCEAVSTNTVNPFTVVAPYSVTVTGNANTCVGGTVTLTAAVTGVLPTDIPTYQWYRVSANGVATPIAGANSAVYTTEPLLTEGSYEYYVGITSSISGCTTNSDSYTANVIADPTVVITGAHSVCEQGQLQLNATVYGGIPGVQYEYTWTWTGASSGSAVTAVPTYTPNLPANDGANHYYFTVTVNPVGTSGCDATSAAHELDVYAVPTVTVTADRSYVCEGGAVTFTANVTPAGNYNYAWTINGVANAANTPSVTTIVNNAGPVSATVTVSANNNIVSCATTATIAVPVQTVADPVVTIAANHTSMCAGGTTTLSVSSITVDNNIPADFSYQWAINGHEIPGAINNTFVQSLTEAGTYTYTLRVTQNGNLGCASEWSAPVTVLVAEQPSVTLYNADGLNICEGGTITLNGIVDNYGNTVNGVLNSSVYGPMTYTWNSNGVVVPSGVHPNQAGTDQLTQTLNNVGNYNYNVVVTPTGYACQPAASNTVTVGVVNDPTWNDVHVYYPDVCVGQQVNLEATIVGGVADYSDNTNGYIQWTVTFNGTTANVAGGQGGNSYDFPAYPGNYVYTPTYVGNIGSGCQLTNTADVEQPVTVHEIPTAMFVTGDGSTICANDPDASVELTIVFTGGAPYTFDIENMMTGEILPYHVSLTDTFRFYVSPDVTTRYRIIALANSYCENNDLGSIASTTVTVNVNAVSFSETTFMPVYCGEDAIISFDITSGNENEAYQVYENGVLIASGVVTDGHIIIPDGLLSEGSHTLTLVIGGCEYEVTVIIPVGSENSELFGENFMDIRWDDVVIINLNANPRYEFVGFQWYRNNELIPGAIYKNYQEIGGLRGFYSVVLTAIDHETGEMVTFQTCPREFNSLSSMKVYPVPATVQQVITIELDLTAEELNGAVLDIYDATGKQINHMTDLTPITKVAGFKAQGTYFGRIITGTNEIKTVKFVIVK
ncbi:MAG: T9SS type A sorting domain-containing protein [Bacteroidales bacterium]|nr:T9SS type A sorting domain-containing protein [Bacteroidales bacterium]